MKVKAWAHPEPIEVEVEVEVAGLLAANTDPDQAKRWLLTLPTPPRKDQPTTGG